MNIHLSYETLIVTTEGNCTTITLNRPKSMNALNEHLLQELLQCLTTLAKDDTQQILIINGSNGVFSAGGDIVDMLLKETTEEEFARVMSVITDIIVTLHTMPKITISVIEGAAAGLGLSLALATDKVVVEKTAIVAMNFIGIGLIPDGGAHYFLGEKVGVHKAKEIIWEGARLTAAEALTKGIIDEVIASKTSYVTDVVSSLRQKPLAAMIKTKVIYANAHRDRLLHILQLEKQGQWKMRTTDDHKEGVDAFLMKRVPTFLGK